MTTATSRLGLAVVLAAATAALVPRSVCAQNADAEALFRDGKRLWDSGEIARACEKFEASERIDPAPGTEVNLARCRENDQRYASAWVLYRTAADTYKHRGARALASLARKQADTIEPKLLYLTIAVPENSRVDGLMIKRNGTTVDAGLWSQRGPVDPDEYTISAEAPGYEPWSTSVVVKTRSKKVEVPRLDKRRDLPAEPRREVRSAAAGSDEPPGARDPGAGGAEAGSAPSRWTGKRKLSLMFAAVGVAATGAGVGLGLHASTLERKADGLCSQSVCNNQDGVNLNRSARSYALAANIGYAAGGVAVVGAAALWLLGAPASRETIAIFPTLDATRVGLSFARSF
jgi:hypothetical protein